MNYPTISIEAELAPELIQWGLETWLNRFGPSWDDFFNKYGEDKVL